MGMWWSAAVKMIPWDAVIQAAPLVLETARRLSAGDGSRKKSDTRTDASIQENIHVQRASVDSIAEQVATMAERIRSVEENIAVRAAEHAEVLQKLAEQNVELVRAVDVLRVRTTVLLWVVGGLSVATALGLVAFALRT